CRGFWQFIIITNTPGKCGAPSISGSINSVMFWFFKTVNEFKKFPPLSPDCGISVLRRYARILMPKAGTSANG
ncbi:MAG: hypothetical protein ACOCP6_02440, partial [Desulfosalsimonas sp.]